MFNKPKDKVKVVSMDEDLARIAKERNRKLGEIVRTLYPLNLTQKQRRNLITNSYICLFELWGCPDELYAKAREAKQKGLEKDEAFDYLTTSIDEYINKQLGENAFIGYNAR